MNTVVFGFGAHTTLTEGPHLMRLTTLADREGLDHFSLSDHPYLGDRLDAYAAIAFVLGRTERLAGLANVSNPLRPAPMLARTVGALASLSGGRVVLGMGAGGRWDRIGDMGLPPLTPGEAVAAFAESIEVVRALFGGGPPVSYPGGTVRIRDIEPARLPAPPIWTGSVGPRSLAVTGRLADGWIPGHAADWASARYRESRPIVDDAARGAGRDPKAIKTVFNLPGEITPQPRRRTRDDTGRWLGGSADQWVDELTAAIGTHGAGGFTLFSPQGDTPDEATLARWAGEVAPGVREAVSAPAP